jgi:hypothetical protein
MKKLTTILTAVAIATSGMALAQSTNSSVQDTARANQPSAKQAMEAEMELQKNKPSKTVTEQEKQMPKYRPSSKDTMQAQMDLQRNKPSRPVDKNAKAPPRPNVSKMTLEEKEALRKEVSKEAKP